MYIGDTRLKVITDAVDATVPLLLSKSSLQTAGAKIDFECNQVKVFDQNIPLTETSGSHYLLSLTCDMNPQSEHVQRILFTSPFSDSDYVYNEQKTSKLHKQFAHPSAKAFKELLRTAGINDKSILKLIDSISHNLIRANN